MRGASALLALVALVTPAAAHNPALTKSYLTGTWVEEGSGGTCDNGFNYQFTADGEIMVDDTPVPYKIEFQTIVYEGVDFEMVEYITPVDHDTFFLKGFEEQTWHLFERC